jgi:hypothetical protein
MKIVKTNQVESTAVSVYNIWKLAEANGGSILGQANQANIRLQGLNQLWED